MSLLDTLWPFAKGFLSYPCYYKTESDFFLLSGDQKAVHQESQGEKIAQSQFLAHGHPGSRDDLALLVPAVLRRQEHRHVHDVRPRESGGLHVELLLLRRVRGEPEEREQRERDDNLTSVSLSDTTRWFCLVLSKFAGESSCRVSEGVAKRIAMAILIPIYLTLNQWVCHFFFPRQNFRSLQCNSDTKDSSRTYMYILYNRLRVNHDPSVIRSTYREHFTLSFIFRDVSSRWEREREEERKAILD